MISVENLSLYFGAQNVFNNISFMVNNRDKIGLVGKNGSGKSTLLKLLTNNLTPNEGSVSILKNIVIGYLEQDIDFKDEYTLIEEMNKVFGNIELYKSELENLNKQITERNDYNSSEYLELLNQLSITEEKLREAIINAGLNEIKFKIDLGKDRVDKLIKLSSFIAAGSGAMGTPSVFINDFFYPGYMPKSRIEDLLKE